MKHWLHYAAWHGQGAQRSGRSGALAMRIAAIAAIAAMIRTVRRFRWMSMRRYGVVAPMPLALTRRLTMPVIVTMSMTTWTG